MNKNSMCPDVLKSRLRTREGSLKVHEDKKRDFHGQRPWRSPLLPKDKREPEGTEKSTRSSGIHRKTEDTGKPWPSGDKKGKTGDRAFLEQTLSRRTHHFLNLPWNIQQETTFSAGKHITTQSKSRFNTTAALRPL